ncbi:hypothetical protein [Prevotella sp.]
MNQLKQMIADNAEKDSYNIMETMLFMLFAVCLLPLRYLRETMPFTLMH